MKSPPALILASTSVYRRELLKRLNLSFSCQASHVDETRAIDESGLAMVRRLARAKALAVSAERPAELIIGSDQAAVLEQAGGAERVLGKPGTAAACIVQLTQSAGHTVIYHTAVCLMQSSTVIEEFVESTEVRFRDLEPAEIERYVAVEAPFDCAGGFKSEALGITLTEAMHAADPTALIGLPLIKLAGALRRAGYALP